MIEWFMDFRAWHNSDFIKELQVSAEQLSESTDIEISDLGKLLSKIVSRFSAEQLSESTDIEISDLGKPLSKIVSRSNTTGMISFFISIYSELSKLTSINLSRKQSSDAKIDAAINLELNRNNQLLANLAEFLTELREIENKEKDALDVDTETDSDTDTEEEEENIPSKIGKTAAYSAYRNALRALARSYITKKPLGKNSRNAKIIKWLGDRLLANTELSEIGKNLIVQSNANKFINAPKNYLTGIPRRYKAFRRLRQADGKWYTSDSFKQTDIHQLELDIILLAILQDVNALLSDPMIYRRLDEQFWSPLRPVHDLYKTQILVDEATDFSPIQLACMAALAQPPIASFFACGDFNQRLTSWGTRSHEEIKWFSHNIDIREITVSYRHSQQLSEFAKAVSSLSDNSSPLDVTLPEYVNNDCVSPVLAENLSSRDSLIQWLAQRIIEIWNSIKKLPSIAILAPGEELVQPIATDLSELLVDRSIKVVACPNGQVKGQDNDVRVFDVQHIKGLEFEAVFFVSIDRLISEQPELFDKYLYVGATRAATYLGVSCEGAFPTALQQLKTLFVEDWA